MQVVLAIELDDTRTLQEQVFDQIRRMILMGLMRGGDPVPGSRALAEQLNVSRNTVTIAYDMLMSEGYLEIRPNIGTFVARDLPDAALHLTQSRPTKPIRAQATGGTLAERLVDSDFPVQAVRSPAARRLHTDFWVGRVDPDSLPLAEWRRIVDLKLRHGGGALSEYGPAEGLEVLRGAIADHLGPARGVACTADEVVITGGSQDGLMLIARALQGLCRTFLHEDPGYQGARFLFARSEMACLPVPVDRDGLIVEALPGGIRNALLYVTPSHQFPTGVTLTLPRRLALLDWAERTDSLIVEDDYDGDFRLDGGPLTALRGLDRTGRVIYLGTFSKSLGPGLRAGFIVCPAAMTPVLARWKRLLSNGPPWLTQAALAEFMNSGAFQRHLRRIRTRYRTRRDVLIEGIERHFPGSEIAGRRGGMHISWRLPDSGCAERLQKVALMRGIGIYTMADGGAWLSSDRGTHCDMLMLGYAAVDEARIESAIAALAEIDAGKDR